MILIICFYYIFRYLYIDSQIWLKIYKIVPLDVSTHWGCLHQDAGKNYSEISKKRSYWKYSKATIWRHIEKQYWRLGGRFTKKKKLGRSPKLSVQHKKNILWQTKLLQEDIGNFCVKRVMVTAGIPSSISMETVCRVLWKAGLKWTHVQRKGFKTKPELQKLWLGENLDNDLILVSLGKESQRHRGECCSLFGSNCIWKGCNGSRTVPW